MGASGCCSKSHIDEESKNESIGPPGSIEPIPIPESPSAVEEIFSQEVIEEAPLPQKAEKYPVEIVDIPWNGVQMVIDRSSLVHVIKGSVNDHYNILSTLGSGTFGCVYKAANKISGRLCAIKSVRKNSYSYEEQAYLMEEVNLLRGLDHPNIINIYEVIEDQSSMNIVMELCTGGELFDRIVESNGFSENKAAEYMFEIMSGVVCCHKEGIVHRDLKPENIVFTNKQPKSPLKIIDFGTSKKVEPNTNLKSFTGTGYYIAPEVIKKNYNAKCDVWSCGVILYIMLCGYPPFNGPDDKTMFTKIIKGKFSFIGREWTRVSPEAKALIMKMLTKDPNQRPSASEIFEEPWIQTRSRGIVKDNPLNKTILSNIGNFRAYRLFQQGTMQYIASQMVTSEEIEDLRKLFVQIDRNGDGKLSLDELRQSQNITGLEMINIEAIIEACDTDKNGYIEYTEFITATMNWKKTLSNERLVAAFQAMDQDASGTLSVAEIQNFFISDISEKEQNIWRELIQQVDLNGDGEIDLGEFKAMMLAHISETA